MKVIFIITTLLITSIFIAMPCYAQGYMGVGIKEVDGQLVVEEVTPRSPGARYRIRQGDIIKAIDGRVIPSRNDFELILMDHEAGDYITVTYIRGKRERTAKVKLERLLVSPEEIVLMQKLLTGENVRLAIVILEVNIISSYLIPEEQNRRWEDALKNITLGHQESYFLKKYRYPDFSLVDRGNVEQVLREISFSSSGFISDTERAKIGSLLRATHIYGISIVKTIDEKGWSTEVQTRKLIDIQSGEILTSSMVSTIRDKKNVIREIHNSWEEGPEYSPIKIWKPRRHRRDIEERVEERKRLYRRRKRH